MKASELQKKLGNRKHKTTSELRQVIFARPDDNPNFCLFLGAGASRSSGIRTASQMVDEWRSMVYRGLSNNTEEHLVPDMKRWLTEHAPDWYDDKREYEYGKKMDGRGIDKKRVTSVAEATDDEMIKGVCHSLLEQDGDAVKVFRAEAEKRFSKIDQCLRWPAIVRHNKELKSIREELLKAKRGLNDLPT